MRCAVYARYSSDLQRDSSIENQIRKCREYASLRGWRIQEQHIRCDRAASAGSMAARNRLAALMADAKLEDSLRTAKQLDFYGVKVIPIRAALYLRVSTNPAHKRRPAVKSTLPVPQRSASAQPDLSPTYLNSRNLVTTCRPARRENHHSRPVSVHLCVSIRR